MAEFDTEAEAARIARQVDATARRAAERFADSGPVSGQARSSDGTVRVEVQPGGGLTDVQLTHQALQDGADALARQITELAATATRRAGDRMYRTLAPVFGTGAREQLVSLGYEPLPDEDVTDDGRDDVTGDITDDIMDNTVNPGSGRSG